MPLALLLLSGILFLVLTTYILLTETKTRFSEFNQHLYIMIFGIIGSFICFYGKVATQKNTFVVGESFSYAVFEFGYLKYSWCRGSGVVKVHFPQLYTIIQWTVTWSPCILFTQGIPNIVSAMLYEKINSKDFRKLYTVAECTTAIVGMFGFLFDMTLIIAFLKKINEGELADNRFRIIAIYGMASILQGFIVLALFITSLVQSSLYQFYIWWTYEKKQKIRNQAHLEGVIGKEELVRIQNRTVSEVSTGIYRSIQAK
ncbi:hypothetical protein HK100_012486 [Physocladia obscura]|uniref:Uncharacterized protein n=1 Tax=Physocladia obscura TaxID=109957 RepID=A0AAD5XHP9_9FUNG|nr:hypothetical protein HK100_012486 [Physocladia obscura]